MTREEKEALKARILEALASPKEIQTDSGRVSNQSVSDSIKAFKYLSQLDTNDASNNNVVKRAGFFKIRNRD